MSAVKEDTRLKRLDQLIEHCAQGRRMGLLTPPSTTPPAKSTATKATRAKTMGVPRKKAAGKRR